MGRRWIALILFEIGVLSTGVLVDAVAPIAPLPIWIVVAVASVGIAIAIYKWPNTQVSQNSSIRELGIDTPKKAGRTYVNRTPREMMLEWEGKTSLQAGRAVSVYIGKWLRVSDSIHDVSEYEHSNEFIVHIELSDPHYHSLRPAFSKHDAGELETARKGDLIVAEGKIEDVKSYQVEVESCELISLTPPQECRD